MTLEAVTRDDIGHLTLAVCFTTIAGYVDAVGFLKLGGLFVSFMSGDSTQLGVMASEHRWNEAGEAFGIIVLFLVGVVLGHLFALWAKDWRRPAILLIDAALLGIAVALAPSQIALFPTVIAMGLQNEALHRVGDIKTNLTYVTGTLVGLGEHIAGALIGSEPEKRWLWIPYLLLWLGLVSGAVIGASVYASQHVAALRWPTIALVVFAAITAGFAWHDRRKGKLPAAI